MLRIPKSQAVQKSMMSLLAEGYVDSQPDFMCTRTEFSNAMTLLNLVSSIACKVKPASSPPSNLSLIEDKLDKLIAFQTQPSHQRPLHTTESQSPPSFADVANSFADVAKRAAKKPRNVPLPPPTNLPPKIPSLILKQSVPSAPVELKTSAEALSARINKAIASACQLAD